MDSLKNGKWIIPFKKFSSFSVKYIPDKYLLRVLTKRLLKSYETFVFFKKSHDGLHLIKNQLKCLFIFKLKERFQMG